MQKVARLLTRNRSVFSQLNQTMPKFRFSVSELPRINFAEEPRPEQPEDKKKNEPKDKKSTPFPRNPKDAWRWIREQFYNKWNTDNPILWFAGWSSIFMVLFGFYLYETYLEEQKISMNVA